MGNHKKAPNQSGQRGYLKVKWGWLLLWLLLSMKVTFHPASLYRVRISQTILLRRVGLIETKMPSSVSFIEAMSPAMWGSSILSIISWIFPMASTYALSRFASAFDLGTVIEPNLLKVQDGDIILQGDYFSTSTAMVHSPILIFVS